MPSPSEQARREIDHPVVDADGHILEYLPAAMPYLRESLGPTLFDRYVHDESPLSRIMGGADWEQRVRTRTPQSAWWGNPARNTRDLATAAIPALLHERVQELGIDYGVLYPTKALGIAAVDDPDLRAGLCRGFNDFLADVYGPFADRLTVAGVVPMVTPEEALEEIEHCRSIGVKVVGLPEGVRRPIPEPDPHNPSPWLLPGQSHWFDTFGLDSAHDYDPVWQRLVDAGLTATFHGGIGHLAPNSYTSISNYVFNHIGSLAERMHRLCKSLFLGGVTRRFPTLGMAFLECGVAWACTLLVDLVEHWEKRNPAALAEHLDPATIDWDELERPMRTYGGKLLDAEGDLGDNLRGLPTIGVEPVDRDEFRFTGIERTTDVRDLFVPRFFFGCEADDRTLAFAFSDANVFGARLQPVFSSDIAHWDVQEMDEAVAEAWGLVGDGVLTEDDFRDFTFTNPVRLFTATAPDFFEGTAVAEAARPLTAR